MRVLLVEDETVLTQTLAAGLQADGFAVDVAGDAENGPHLAQTTAYDAIVLAIMLPGLSGYDVVRWLAPVSTSKCLHCPPHHTDRNRALST